MRSCTMVSALKEGSKAMACSTASTSLCLCCLVTVSFEIVSL